MVHISDISWTDHIVHPGDKYKKGDPIEAVILAIDIPNKRVSLGIKQLDRDPWESIEVDFPVGKIVKGIVSKTTHFGAFIRFDNGVEGLVHISELSNKEVAKVEDYVQLDEAREFKVVKVSKEERKLGLSLRVITEPEETKEKEAGQEKQDRQERKERSDRPQREKKVDNRKSAPTHSDTSSRSGGFDSSMKSALQQALEEHAEKAKEDK